MAKSFAKTAKGYRVAPGKNFWLKSWDPADTAGLDLEKKRARALLEEGIERLAEHAFGEGHVTPTSGSA